MPALPRRADRRGDHLIVCGDGPLSYRITEELTSRYGEQVTVILPDRRNHHGPQISALPRVRVLEYPELSSQAFTDADVQSAQALAVADGTPRNPLARRRNPALVFAGMLRRLVGGKFGMVFAALLGVIVVGFVLLATVYRFADALYLTLMDLTGSALTSPRDTSAEKVAQVMLTVDGMAFIPVITALVVGARLTGSVRRAPRPTSDHVIVVGLGNVGTAVTGQLHDLGFNVVCVDNDPNAPGIPLARQLGLPVVIGDAFREETLRAAHLDTCLALVSVTSLDVVNLETALTARALRSDLRLVLRLTDDDLAERLEKTTGNFISRSVPYLAAPAFATAMLEHQVLRTIAVGRHVLLIAGIRVADQAGLAGSSIRDTEQDGQARVLALQASGVAALTPGGTTRQPLPPAAAGPNPPGHSAGHRTAATCSRPATGWWSWPPAAAWGASFPCTELVLGRGGQALILMTCQEPPMPLPAAWPGALSPM